MNTKKLHENTITLAELSKQTTEKERNSIEAEKKYYQLVVALKEKREALGITQEKLSELSQVPRTTITRVESGHCNATLDTLMKIAEALGASVELRLV